MDVIGEKQGIETQYAFEHYIISNVRGMLGGWDVYPDWLEENPQRVLVKSSRRIARCDFYCYLEYIRYKLDLQKPIEVMN